MSSLLEPMNPVDSTKYAQQATEIRKSQPVHDHTSAEDMRIVLRGHNIRAAYHENNVKEWEGKLAESETQWKDLRKALKAAEAMVGVRPHLREDIASLKARIAKCEEDGADIKRNLEIQRNVLAGIQKLIDEFDHQKLARLEKEEAALAKVGLI
jgi:chromosome segregation ATPase